MFADSFSDKQSDLKMKIVALDFETADYYADSACALALVSIVDGRIKQKRTYYIRPPRKSFLFTDIHGISWDDVRDQPTFADLTGEIEQLVSGAEYLAAHNAPFDRKVFLTCYAASGITHPEIPFICTVRLARAAWDIHPTKLPNVCAYLGIDLKHHDPASDALACAQITIEAMKRGTALEDSKLGPPTYSVTLN